VRLVVNNYLEDKESSNVIGVIRGEVEPDRYVIIGMAVRKKLSLTMFVNIEIVLFFTRKSP
jgi:hypothetical protein